MSCAAGEAAARAGPFAHHHAVLLLWVEAGVAGAAEDFDDGARELAVAVLPLAAQERDVRTPSVQVLAQVHLLGSKLQTQTTGRRLTLEH